MTLPNYISRHCNDKEMYVCRYFMVLACPGTCAYAQEIRELGVGALMPEDVGRLEALFNK